MYARSPSLACRDFLLSITAASSFLYHVTLCHYMAPAIMCFGRKPSATDPESRKNAEIEKNLRGDRKRAEREVKLLLLGMHVN